MGVGSSVLAMSKIKSNRKINYVENIKHVKIEKVNQTPPPGIRGKSLRMWNSPRAIKNVNK
tara:strand:- start:506 stop:688 length:183 start_codon:yes stop_codon:yes gene_type:complete